MDTPLNMAVFCDYENLAIGAKEVTTGRFDIGIALEQLLNKGKVVFKKAYADWERYKDARKSLHEHAFEMVEIPHVSMSGKNSADIRMVVDALDLCHTKTHVDTFVIMSGDSDFSPLVSKLRENNRVVIGIGFKKSTSNLLIENCDEFIYYDDLVKRRDRSRQSNKPIAKKPLSTKGTSKPPAPEKKVVGNGKDLDERREEAVDLVVNTIDSLIDEREAMLWGPTVRRAIKRKKPNFSESYYGFRTFNQILEECERQGHVDLKKDNETGNYAIITLNTL